MENEIRNEEVVNEQLTMENFGVEVETPKVEEVTQPESTIVEEPTTDEAVVETPTEVEEPPVVDELPPIADPVETEPAVVGIVTPAHLNIRSEASKDSDIVSILNKNDEVKIVEELDGFYKVFYNGLIGYCVKEFISIK